MSALQAILFAVLQGITELFPVSSLGHAVVLPALLGWRIDQHAQDFLPFLVVLHVGTAAALLLYFWRDWIDIALAVLGLGQREQRAGHLRLLALIVVGTIPAVIVGFALEKPIRNLFGTPSVAASFLIVNGVILYCGERFRPRSSIRADQEIAAQREEALVPAGARRPPGPPPPGMARQARHASGQQAVRQEELVQAIQADERLAGMGYLRALIIGASQILALLAGISRDGVSMVTGMNRGLAREDAARFAFLLATPVILAAGVLELPKLTGPEGQGIHGQILVGSLLSGIGAYVSVRFLMRYFQTRTLTPFAIYCFVFGLLSVIYLGVIK